MAVTTAAVIGAASAIGGTAMAAKGASDARKAAAASANAPAPQVNIAQTDQLAREAALRNAQDSAALEKQFNPGAADLRAGSLQALIASLNDQGGQNSIFQSFVNQGAPALSPLGTRPGVGTDNAALLAQIAAQAGQPLTNQGFDSALTRAAVQRAQDDLALGSQLPQDVRNLVARQALARSGSVTGGLGLGRDLMARDLGLTSLDLRNQRLQAAAQLGSQEAGLEQANAAMRAQAEQFGRQNLLQSQSAIDAQDARAAQNYATDAQIAANRDALAASNYFNQAGLFNQIANGDFARALSAAQFGQNIAQPMSGLDPGSIANLAVGNVNSQAGKQQQAFGLQAGAANALTGFGSQLAGTGMGALSQYYNRPAAAPVYTPSPTPYTSNVY
jgi:hypothetical protein